MIDGIFKRLTPSTAEALQRVDTAQDNGAEINVDDLTTALTSVKSDLVIANASLQKLYEEANYVYSRLDHMEQSMSAKNKAAKKSAATDSETGGSEGSDGGDTGGSSSGQGGIIVEKQMFIGGHEGKLDEKLSKIREAKELTQDLLQSIERLAIKVEDSKTLSESPRSRM